MKSVTGSLTQRRVAKNRAEVEVASRHQSDIGKERTKDDISNNGGTTIRTRRPFRMVDWLDGVGGTVHFSFFQAPEWVDLRLPPGTTSQNEMYRSNPKLLSILTGHSIIYSPNLIWLAITALVYLFFPYDMEAAKAGWDPIWFRNRAILNVSIVLLYYGYWHTALHGLGWAKRPFAQGRVYRWSKTVHNVYYCLLGTIQWTAWEFVMVHLYATKRIDYQRDEEIFGSWKGFANFVACCLFVPVFREVQFFFAHRFIHTRCLYKYIHSLHHRNTDVEPFSGLCMSPAEHLYYISSIAPSIYWHASPFQFLWNGIHLLLSPGASHSGWEDHWHSDQFHVAHHRYFECNYGTPGMPLDRWFGTFRETLAPQTTAYQGDAVECVSKKGSTAAIKARDDSKSTLLGLPPWDQMLYNAATAIGLPLLVYNATIHREDQGRHFLYRASFTAFLVSAGPLLLAAILALLTANPPVRSIKKFQYAMFYPFHRESLAGKYGVMTICSILCSILPVYHFIHSLLVQDPQDTIYHRIWSA